MIIQVNPSGGDTADTPSRTEGHKAVVESVKEEGLSNDKDKTFSYKTTDLREKTPESRAIRVAELRRSLASLDGKTSNRSVAMKASIMYKLKVLCK